MKDVTDILNTYRECVRHLWNVYFLGLISSAPNEWDLSDEFQDICVSLFSSLVLGPLNRSGKKQPAYKKFQEPLMCLRVVPGTEHGVGININREVKCSGYWDYPIKIIKPSDADLRFIDYFDFDMLGSRQFEYCHVRIVASEQYPDLVGRDALLGSNHVRIMLVEE